MLDPEYLDDHQAADSEPVDPFGPGPLMAGLVLVASLLLEVNRLGKVVARLEVERMRRVHSQQQRAAAALAVGKTYRRPGRPKKIAIAGDDADAGRTLRLRRPGRPRKIAIAIPVGRSDTPPAIPVGRSDTPPAIPDGAQAPPG